MNVCCGKAGGLLSVSFSPKYPVLLISMYIEFQVSLMRVLEPDGPFL
jgi:hypothetical protein